MLNKRLIVLVCNFYLVYNGIQPQRYKLKIPDWAWLVVGDFPAFCCGRGVKESSFCSCSIIGCVES